MDLVISLFKHLYYNSSKQTTAIAVPEALPKPAKTQSEMFTLFMNIKQDLKQYLEFFNTNQTTRICIYLDSFLKNNYLLCTKALFLFFKKYKLPLKSLRR